MSYMRLFEMAAGDVPTPPAGKSSLFIDSATGEWSYKDDTGTVTSLVGIPGPGVPVGGTAGQVLSKIDGTNYNTQWVAAGGTYIGTAGSITLTGNAFSIDAAYVGQASITTLGTVATGTWNATAISAVKGGTGQTGYTVGDILYASTTTALSPLAAGTATHVLTSNGAGVAPSWQAAGGGGGLTGFTSSLETASPNNTNNVSKMLASGGTTNQFIALQPKGTGGVMAQTPDSAAAGGNVRGANSTDWQTSRAANTQVASGVNATIGGGVNNTASNSGATVSGGQSNVASSTQATVGGGNGNSATAATSTVGGGASNQATVLYGTVGGGSGNVASTGQGATVSGGESNTASALRATVAGGILNTANGAYSWIPGGYYGTTRSIYGAGAYASGRFSADGDAQHRSFVLRSDTTNATPEAMTTENAAASTTNQVILPNNSAFTVTGTIVARESGGNARSWKVEAFIVRGANAAATTLVAGGTPAIIGTSGGFTGTLALTADTTNGGLAITVTGVAATNIKWVADLVTAEVAG